MAACVSMLHSSWKTAVAAQGRSASIPAVAFLPHRTWQRSNVVAVTAKKGNNKSKAPKKADLPSKGCLSCGRPFSWRKKWELVWDDVKYCSDRCRSQRPKGSAAIESPTASC